jgi:hypothetical protein
MTQIFISYAREDKEFVDELKKQLEPHSYATWIDSEDIRAGKNWRNEIDKGINDPNLVLLVMTPEAERSKYVAYECTYARGAGKNVIPILLENTEMDLPCLKDTQYVDFREIHDWNKLLTEISAEKNELSLRILRVKGLYPAPKEKDKPKS